MALIKCKECGQEVSKKAAACPKCGAPIRKKTSLFTWIVTAFFVFVAIGYFANQNGAPSAVSSAAASSASPQKTKPTARTYGLKQTIHIGYTSYEVWRAFYRNHLTNNPYTNQKPNATYLFVYLTARNDDKKPRMIPPFTLVDDQGDTYQTSDYSSEVAHNIGLLDSLNPGVKKTGYIVFDVPRGKHYRLKISGGYWSDASALVDLGLKR